MKVLCQGNGERTVMYIESQGARVGSLSLTLSVCVAVVVVADAAHVLPST